MQFQPAKVFALLLFVSTPILMLLGVINAFANSFGLQKAVNFFQVLSLGSLVILLGIFLVTSLGVTFNFKQIGGVGAAQPPAAGGTAPSNNPKGGFSA